MDTRFREPVSQRCNRIILLALAALVLLPASCKVRSSTLQIPDAAPTAGQREQTPADGTGIIPGQAARWVGVSWHTLCVFSADGAATRFYSVPGTGEGYAAIFDFTIAEGSIWIPNSTMNFGDPSVIRLDASDPSGKHEVIRLHDPVSASEPNVAVPFNVAADDQWLYVLRKYSLVRSQLTRMSLRDTSERSSLVLPADGGGLVSQMAVGTLNDRPVLAVMLYEGCAIIDRSSFQLVGFCQDARLNANIVYSKHLGAFVCAGVGESFDISSPAEAGEYMATVIQNRGGGLMYSVPEVLTIRLSGGKASLSVHRVKLGSPVTGVQVEPSATFDLNDAGNVAVCQSGNCDGLHAIDLDTMAVVDTQRYPRGQVLGSVGCIGGDVFAIGGNLLYDCARHQFTTQTGTPFTGWWRLMRLP